MGLWTNAFFTSKIVADGQDRKQLSCHSQLKQASPPKSSSNLHTDTRAINLRSALNRGYVFDSDAPPFRSVIPSAEKKVDHIFISWCSLVGWGKLYYRLRQVNNSLLISELFDPLQIDEEKKIRLPEEFQNLIVKPQNEATLDTPNT